MAKSSNIFGLSTGELLLVGGAAYLFLTQQDNINKTLGGAANAIGGIGGGLGTAAEGFGSGASDAFTGVGSGLGQAGSGIGGAIGGIGNLVQQGTDNLKGTLQSAQQEQQIRDQYRNLFAPLVGTVQGQTNVGLEQIRAKGALLRESDIQTTSTNLTGTVRNLTSLPLSSSQTLATINSGLNNRIVTTLRGFTQAVDNPSKVLSTFQQAGNVIFPSGAIANAASFAVQQAAAAAAAARAAAQQSSATGGGRSQTSGGGIVQSQGGQPVHGGSSSFYSAYRSNFANIGRLLQNSNAFANLGRQLRTGQSFNLSIGGSSGNGTGYYDAGIRY